MSENFLMKKNIDRSIFNRGFAIPVEMQAVFSLHLSGGELRHGEKRTIKIILNDKTFDATITSINFDRKNIQNTGIFGKLFILQPAKLQPPSEKFFRIR